MGVASDVLYFALHPNQLGVLVQWKLRHVPIHKRDETQESATAKICFEFLDQTGRSFSPVVKELHPELLLPPLLRNFNDYLDQDGWTFTGNRPEEKDRALLVQFDNVITEFRKLKPTYQAIIKDVTDEMGNGMADFARKAALGDVSVNSVEEFDLYCWHVAGIVGEGLTHLFVEVEMGESTLINHSLYRSMGLLLQKNNIIRDIREDFDDDLFEPKYLRNALNCSSEMVLNAIKHASDTLSYLAGLREQSVFNFCAMSQTMALATLELCFRNPVVFEQNVKITKGDALQLMVESSQDLEGVVKVFCRYVRRIQRKNDPEDPNFLRISIACEEIEKFAETLALESVELAQKKTERKEHQAGPNAGQVIAALAVASIFVLGISWLIAHRSSL
ncbi:hypothetical protein N7478_000891 [Penicillium angulare]|uniref:uncharacterized protein n=1 Tax=Penicillium angulare TaxID=116970 RepID=UPI00253F7D9D|nr:uncharacterized protein N7478_000891 [Penicillium angulare]KAJ5291640.1 hypothetical protein N7478_000891 [Penicillium angulare]